MNFNEKKKLAFPHCERALSRTLEGTVDHALAAVQGVPGKHVISSFKDTPLES